jgi:hypothetical protein
MIERQISPGSLAPKKSNTGMFIGIAAAIVIILGIGGYLWKSRQTTALPVAASTTSVTTTAPTSTAPIPAGHGVLLLSASPTGDLVEKIVDDKGKPINVTDEERQIPTRIELEPGQYAVTVAGPNGKTQTMNIQVEAGKSTKRLFDLGGVNYDELEKEIAKP